MDHAWKIKKMYKLLSATDIKTICKNRKLPVNKYITADTFKNFMSSTVGIDNAISLLSLEEVSALLLIKVDESLDTSHYTMIYQEDDYGTFTQRYKRTYKMVMQNLVKKGILIVHDDNYGDSKLERIKFTFPKEFREKLPAPFSKIIEGSYKSEKNDITLRSKINKIYKELPANIKTNLYIDNDLLKFNADIFNLSALDRWRKESLAKYITKEYREPKRYSNRKAFWQKIDIVTIIMDAFKRLKVNQFVPSEGINIIFKVVYGDQHGINLENILVKATALGFLGQIILYGKSYYQYKNTLEEIDITEKEYLISSEPSNNKFELSLDKIPYKRLEQLACLCSFYLDNKKTYIEPDFFRLVKIYHSVKNTDLLNYLKKNSLLLNNKIDEIDDKHGKVLLHSNLLVAKINNYKLKAIVEKTYIDESKVILLPNDYIAFIQEELTNIEKLVTKSGFAVKHL